MLLPDPGPPVITILLLSEYIKNPTPGEMCHRKIIKVKRLSYDTKYHIELVLSIALQYVFIFRKNNPDAFSQRGGQTK